MKGICSISEKERLEKYECVAQSKIHPKWRPGRRNMTIRFDGKEKLNFIKI